jgi:hypothetical protein
MTDRLVLIEMPEAAYDLMMETLSMDLESSMIDSGIRQELEKALNHMVVETIDTVHPESQPTCEGCGGQIEHPTLRFTFAPENGLCAMELDECTISDDDGEELVDPCAECRKDYFECTCN